MKSGKSGIIFSDKLMSQKGFASIYIILGLILVVAAVGGVFFLTRSDKNSQPVSEQVPVSDSKDSSKEADKFIVSNPVDLTQIKKISKFRSCSGHDFSGQNADGVREKNRSMKHYFKPVDSLAESIGEVKVFAPYNGRIKSVTDEREPRGKQIILNSENNPWDVTIFHVDLLPSFKGGSEIKAGQLLGHAHIASRGSDFDIVISRFVGGVPDFKNLSSDQAEKMQDFFFSMMMMDSIFNYMTPAVASEFEKFGVNYENIIITAEERDKTACTFERSENPGDWIELQY